MIFHADTAFALELLALVAAGALLLGAKKSEGAAKGLVMAIAYFSMVAAILALLCTSYYAFRYREDGWFKSPFPPPRGMGMGGQGMMGEGGMMGGGGFMGRPGMRGGDGGRSPMMEQKMKMMQEKMEQMKQEGGPSGETKSPGPNDEKTP